MNSVLRDKKTSQGIFEYNMFLYFNKYHSDVSKQIGVGILYRSFSVASLNCCFFKKKKKPLAN